MYTISESIETLVSGGFTQVVSEQPVKPLAPRYQAEQTLHTSDPGNVLQILNLLIKGCLRVWDKMLVFKLLIACTSQMRLT